MKILKYIQQHFLGRTNIDPAPTTRKDLESSENILSDEDSISESKEDVVHNNNAFSADSSLSDVNDGSDEENEHTAEQLFTITVQAERQQHINEQNICIDIPYGIYYIYAYFLMTWYLTSTK